MLSRISRRDVTWLTWLDSPDEPSDLSVTFTFLLRCLVFVCHSPQAMAGVLRTRTGQGLTMKRLPIHQERLKEKVEHVSQSGRKTEKAPACPVWLTDWSERMNDQDVEYWLCVVQYNTERVERWMLIDSKKEAESGRRKSRGGRRILRWKFNFKSKRIPIDISWINPPGICCKQWRCYQSFGSIRSPDRID